MAIREDRPILIERDARGQEPAVAEVGGRLQRQRHDPDHGSKGVNDHECAACARAEPLEAVRTGAHRARSPAPSCVTPNSFTKIAAMPKTQANTITATAEPRPRLSREINVR